MAAISADRPRWYSRGRITSGAVANGLDPVAAAALPMAVQTAHSAVTGLNLPEPADNLTVFVNGAGTAATQSLSGRAGGKLVLQLHRTMKALPLGARIGFGCATGGGAKVANEVGLVGVTEIDGKLRP